MTARPCEPEVSPDDATLAYRFKQGDEAGFDALFNRYKDAVHSLVRRTVGSGDVDDAAQEAFIRIYRGLRKFRGDSSLRTWIYRIVMNTCIDFTKRRMWIDQPLVDIPDDIASTENPETDAARAWTADQVRKGISGLSPGERFAIELHYIHDLSYSEIAEVLNCPSGTVKARIHRAIVRLRSELARLSEEVS